MGCWGLNDLVRGDCHFGGGWSIWTPCMDKPQGEHGKICSLTEDRGTRGDIEGCTKAGERRQEVHRTRSDTQSSTTGNIGG